MAFVLLGYVTVHKSIDPLLRDRIVNWVLSTHYVDPEMNLISLLLKHERASFDDIYLIYYSHKYLETTSLSYSIVLLS